MSAARELRNPDRSEGNDGFAETVMLPMHSARCVLRVLSGDHTDAESEIVTDRLLIGNLEHECDIVLDVKRDERHACLVRVSDDGWTVLSIAGELWLGEEFIPPQQTRALQSGQVLTLGRVAFCIADPDRTDWRSIKVPLQLVKPDPEGPLPQAALLPSRSAVLQKWRALKLAAGLGLGVLVLASAGAYLPQAWLMRRPSAEAAMAKLEADRKLVAALPYGRELNLQPHPETANKLLVQGYLPERQQLGPLDEQLRRVDTVAEYRVHMVDDMSGELLRRFDAMPREHIRYAEQGRFELRTALETLPQHDRQARVALQEMPALNALALRTTDVFGSDGQPMVVRYERSAERPGDLLVHNLDEALGRKPFTVREVRLGEMPSVVLNDGLRYFVDARLPDGSRIEQIEAERVVVLLPQGARREVRFDQVSVTRDEPPARAPAARRR